VHGPTRLSVLSALALAIVLLLGASTAAADPTEAELAQAKALFERGRALIKSGDTPHACPLFEESQRIVPALGTELNLAQCWADTGRLLAAHDLFASVEQRARDSGQQARVDLARQGLASLDRKIPHISIAISGGTAKVMVDDKTVDPSAPIAVDPGSHHVVANGDGGRNAERTVETKADGAATKVELDVSPLAAPPPPPPPPPPPSHLRSRITLVMATVAAGSLVGSIALGAVARSKSDAADGCLVAGDVATCPPAEATRLRSAGRYGDAATAAFIAGVVLGGGALALHLTRPDEGGIQVRPAVTAQSGSVMLEGRW
jgi:hypothetical protein